MSKKIILIIIGIVVLAIAGFFMASRSPSSQPPPMTIPTTPAAQTTEFSNGRIFCSGDENGKPVIFSYAPDGSDKKVIDFPAAYIGWSRDGSKAWVTATDGKLWSMNPDGTEQKLVASFSGGGAGTPVPSPDDKLIAFTGLGIDTNHQEVWIMNSDGSNPHSLTKTTASSITRNKQKITWSVHPSWTPNGQKLAYASTQSGSTQIWTMNADGSNATQITTSNAPDSPDSNVPEYSLDGKSIVFWSGYETEYGDIWVMDADGTNKKRITNEPENVNADNPTWSPDGQWVIFISNRGGGTGAVNAWLVGRSGGTPKLLSGNSDYCAWQPIPEASSETKLISAPKSVKLEKIPANAEIIFWSTRRVSGANQMAPSNLYVMDKEGSHVSQITFSPENYGHAAVSPDRRYIAAIRDIYDSGEIRVALYSLDLEKGTEARLVPNFHSAGSGGIDWSPDGFIYFVARPKPGEGQNVYKIKPDGTGFKQLTFLVPRLDPSNPDPASHSDLSVSEDGTLIAALRVMIQKKDGQLFQKPQIWVMNSDGTNQRMVDDGGTETGNSPNSEPVGDYDPEISPDNKYVIFSRSNSQYVNFKDSLNTAHNLWIAPIDKSAPAKRITQPGPISIIPDWHNGKILYTEYSEKENYVGLVTINPDGTGKTRLESHPNNVWDGGRHGKWILK